MMEGGWERPRNHGRMLGERDGNNEPLAECDEDDDDKYGEDGDIPNDDYKYAIGINGVCVLTCPLGREGRFQYLGLPKPAGCTPPPLGT